MPLSREMSDSAEINLRSADHESKSSGKLGSGMTPALRACIKSLFGEAAHADQSAVPQVLQHLALLMF